MKLNNRGQSLVMFILILPIILIIMLIVYDIGSAIVQKQKLNNINYIAMDYGLSNMDKNFSELNIKELIKLNDKNISNIEIKKDNNILYIKITKDNNGILSGLLNISIIELSSKYKGTIEKEKKNIERVKW